MSLLLQALRQIESRSPECFAPSDAPAKADQAPAVAAIAIAPPLPKKMVSFREAPTFDAAVASEQLFADKVLACLGATDRVLAIVSADDSEVLNSLAARLALALAACTNDSILLIEPAPSTLRLADRGPIVAWADLLAGRIAADDAVRATVDERVGLIHFAPLPKRLPFQDSNQGWSVTFGRYQRIVLNAGTADASNIVLQSSMCDAAFLVIRLGESGRQQARLRVELLRHAGIDLRACLVVEP